jgi:uncharacterized protein with HEPN domain
MQRDDALIGDMLAYSLRARGYIDGVSEAEFSANPLVQDAVIRCLLVIGEAAGAVSSEYRDCHPGIPWAQMSGMRNRLVHDYREVDLCLVWSVAANGLTALVAALEPLAPPADYNDIPADWEFL